MSEIVRLSLAKLSDAERIASMSRTLIEAGLGWGWTAARIKRKILCSETNVLTAKTAVSLVGFSIMQFSEDDAHLLLLAVTPPYQRQGLGHGLLSWQEKSARVAGIARITLEVRSNNHVARKFYQKLGYNIVKSLPNYYRGREHALRMVRELRASVN